MKITSKKLFGFAKDNFFQKLIISFFFLQILCDSSLYSFQRIILNQQLTYDIKAVLSAGNKMHTAYFHENWEEINLSLKDVLKKIEIAKITANKHRDFNSLHILKYLNTIKINLEIVTRSNMDEKNEALKMAFHQLADIFRTFDIKEDYNIFYCKNDNTTWIQKGKIARHPLNPKLQCGLSVL